MDELETLNMLLRLIGSAPVNSTDTNHPDAANALATMDRNRKRVQRRGWWCNIAYNVEYQPDSRGEIKIPSPISVFVPVQQGIVVRDDKLYDSVNNTYKFSASVIAKRVVRVLDWDDMPYVMQEYAAYVAAGEFVRDELEDYSKLDSIMQSAAQSFLDLKKQELDEAQYNIFQTSRIRQARAPIQPYHRGVGHGKFSGDPDR